MPLDLSIGSFRYCRADVNVRTPIKGVYLMKHIAAIWEKATTCCLWFSFPLRWFAMLDQSLVCFTNYFLYTLLGCFTYQHWLYPLLQCFCWCQNTHQVNVFNDTYSNHMGKGNKMSVIFISFRSGWFAMLEQSLVRSTKHCLYTLLQYL